MSMATRALAVTIVASLCAHSSYAAQGAQTLASDKCDSIRVSDNAQCSMEILNGLESKLAAVLKEYLAWMDKVEAQVGNVYRMRETAVAAQDAWDKYRRAECQHVGATYPGAESILWYYGCMIDMTKERIAHLSSDVPDEEKK